MSKLFILRHGETDWNTKWKLQGRTDIPLNENGKKQAKEAAERLKDMPFDVIFSSPLSRAYDTACEIAKPHNLEVIKDDRLIEMGFGIYEGTEPSYNEIDPNRNLFFTAPQDFVISEGGETFEEMDFRCRDFLDFVRNSEYQCVLCVSHGALVRGMMRAALNTPLERFWENGVLNNCALLEINLYNNH